MKKSSKKIIFIILGIILIASVIVIVIFLSNNNKTPKEEVNLKFLDRVEKLENLNTYGITKYGWLQVQGTNIDLPIISPLFNGDLEFDYAWMSSTSIGYKTRKVIVGHNILNVSSTPMVNNSILTGFEDLMAFVYYNFAKENMYLSYTENGNNDIYIIYGIGFYDYNYDNGEGYSDPDEIKKYIKQVKENSIYKYDVDVDENDKIITLKTCTRFFGSEEKQQFVIDARKLRDDEKILKYTVEKTKLYYEYNLIDYYQEENRNLGI